jgi:glutamyl-tRNA reductase
VSLREKLAFDEGQVTEALRRFGQAFPEAEAVLLSTCNRVELYWSRPIHSQPRIAEAIEFVARFHGQHVADLSGVFYNYMDAEAVRHLFRVTSSLDSMVLGESQILAQVRAAFEAARRAGRVGKMLGELFPRAFAVAKEIHSRTNIAAGRVSVGSVAVDLARQVFASFDDKTVLMVGAGKMGEVTLNHLLAARPRRLWVTNRTHQRAAELAERIRRQHTLDVEVVPIDGWIDRLGHADIVITSTGAREPILSADQFAPVPRQREYRPLLIIDIAVPRDIDSRVAEQDNVFLYNIDDLQLVTEATLSQRREALDNCREIIETCVVQYLETQARRDLTPVIQALQDRLGGIADQELNWLLPKLESMSEHDRKLVEQMLHRLTQKILHSPIDLLREKSGVGTAQIYADMLAAMFDLKIESELSTPPPGLESPPPPASPPADP